MRRGTFTSVRVLIKRIKDGTCAPIADVVREHFDTTDLVDAIDSATWETGVDSDLMIVTSVRLPKSLLA